MRLTRAEWQCVQYEETVSYAVRHAGQLALAASAGAAADSSSFTAADGEKPGDRETMIAALAVVKAAHATSVALAARGEAEQGETTTGWAAKLQESFRDGGGSPIRGGGGGARREGGGGDEAAAGVGGSGEGVRAVAALLLVLSKAYQHLTQFRCPEVR